VIPVKKQLEPDDFEEKVRKKGQKFLEINPKPTNWDNRSYWRDALPDLWRAYGAICAYSCHWIPLDQGSASVDHFVPKSVAPERAYDWSNYRLANSKMNAKKGDAQDILDPIGLMNETFILLFPAMLVKPNPLLLESQKALAKATINRLDLNDDEALVQQRLRWVLNYCDRHISFQFLKKNAPFIASEIERQKIIDKLPQIFKRREL
jgi:hypothetical protein